MALIDILGSGASGVINLSRGSAGSFTGLQPARVMSLSRGNAGLVSSLMTGPMDGDAILYATPPTTGVPTLSSAMLFDLTTTTARVRVTLTF